MPVDTQRNDRKVWKSSHPSNPCSQLEIPTESASKFNPFNFPGHPKCKHRNLIPPDNKWRSLRVSPSPNEPSKTKRRRYPCPALSLRLDMAQSRHLSYGPRPFLRRRNSIPI